MAVAGVLIFRAASHVLGEDLVALPIPRAGGTLRREGVYGQVRHPIYSSIVLGLVGWALLWTSVIGLALSFVCVTFFVFKTQAEERYLRATYPGYQHYERTVPRFFPRIH
jgi:protein-S-isoprenylcysteine O-methyltransferase Ste14